MILSLLIVANDFQYLLPPIKGLMPSSLGLIAILLGGWYMQSEKGLPYTGIIFLCGCAFFAFGMCIVLPWSVGNSY